MTKRLDEKLAVFAPARRPDADFILADAKDADMAFGVAAPDKSWSGRFRPRIERLLEVVEDYGNKSGRLSHKACRFSCCCSASTLEKLAIEDAL